MAAALTAFPAFAQAPAAAAKSADNMQILRDKLSGDKKLVVTANMDLTEAEVKAFWPLYEAYQKDLHKINDRIDIYQIPESGFALQANWGGTIYSVGSDLK